MRLHACICPCTSKHIYLALSNGGGAVRSDGQAHIATVLKIAVCLDCRVQIAVEFLQCERNARGTSRGQARQAGHDLQELRSDLSGDFAPFVYPRDERDQQFIRHGLSSLLPGGHDVQQQAVLWANVSRGEDSSLSLSICAEDVCVPIRACIANEYILQQMET
jgi:hypothetical protein